MKTIELRTITIFILLAGLLSCQKKETTIAVPDDLQINISTPTEGAVYKKGDNVAIKADILYISQLHGYIVQITDEDGTILFETEGHSHGDKITIEEYWNDTLSYSANLNLLLTAVVDHDENQKTIKMAFKSQP